MKNKLLLPILMILTLFIISACSKSESNSNEPIVLTTGELEEISKAKYECSALQDLAGALDVYYTNKDFEECVEDKLGFGTEGRYKKYKEQQAQQVKENQALYQKQSDIDTRLSRIVEKQKQGIEVKWSDYWELDKLKSFKQELNNKLEAPIDKISVVEFKEENIRSFSLLWKKSDVLNDKEQIKADYISSLKKAVNEIVSLNAFEVITVYVNDGETQVGSLSINTAKVNQNTDFSQVVTQGNGIFER